MRKVLGKKRKKMGKKGEKWLLSTLPLAALQAGGLAFYAVRKDAFSLACQLDTVSLILDRLGMVLLFSVMGSLLFDLLEKRDDRS